MDNWRTRCDWCGWPLKEKIEDGCTWNSCSMRPMPHNDLTDIKQECRKAEGDRNILKGAVEKWEHNKDADSYNFDAHDIKLLSISKLRRGEQISPNLPKSGKDLKNEVVNSDR
jgi:hypothetical protein